MKYGVDPAPIEYRQRLIACVRAGQQYVVHVCVVSDAIRDDGTPEPLSLLEGSEPAVVALPDPQALSSDPLLVLQLSPQKRSGQLTRGERRAQVQPRVLVDLTAIERATVRSLLLKNLRSIDERRVVDDERFRPPR